MEVVKLANAQNLHLFLNKLCRLQVGVWGYYGVLTNLDEESALILSAKGKPFLMKLSEISEARFMTESERERFFHEKHGVNCK